jgi:ATP-dependent Clp protease ATP-binding subunit ClpA
LHIGYGCATNGLVNSWMTTYSHHARRALTHADTLAARYHHPGADTSHLLVGIMLAEGSVGYQVLVELNLTAERCEPLLESFHPLLDEAPGDAAAASRAALDAALQLAADESAWLGHHYIGTEHLLLGITRTNVGHASTLFKLLDVPPEDVHHQVERALSNGLTEFSLPRSRRDSRLSELSRRVINAAEQLAVSLDHPTICIGHLLLELMQEKRSLTSVLLLEGELDEACLREALNQRDPALMVSIETVIDQASKTARELGDHYIGTDHMLMIMMLDSSAVESLKRCGLVPDVVLRRLEEMFQNKR